MFAILIAFFVLIIPVVFAVSSSTEVEFDIASGGNPGKNTSENSNLRTIMNVIAVIIVALLVWLFFFSRKKVKSHAASKKAVKSSKKKKRR